MAPHDNRSHGAPYNDNYLFDVDKPTDYIELPASYPEGAFFLQGFFFNYRYWYRASRPPLTFTQRVKRYVQQMYAPLYKHYAVATLHLRLGYEQEPSPELLLDRSMPPRSFWRRAVEEVERMHYSNVNCDKSSSTKELIFLVFSDASEYDCHSYIGDLLLSRNTLFIDEDALTSIHMMNLADYNVLTASTFSLWGAHLNQKNAPALVHECIFKDHGYNLYPPEDKRWVVFRE